MQATDLHFRSLLLGEQQIEKKLLVLLLAAQSRMSFLYSSCARKTPNDVTLDEITIHNQKKN